MKSSRASIRYAKATLAFAEEANASQAVSSDIQSLLTLMKQSDALNSVLENPMLSSEKKQSILKEVLPNMTEQTQRLFSLLATNNRMELLRATCEQYLHLFAAKKGEVEATVVTAIPLTPELEEQILQQTKIFSSQKAVLKNKIDPSIIGGYILKIGDMQFDASVSNQLRAIKTTLTKSNTI
jgi:F-type H+-transporting ATPase subunit delta